MYQNLEPVFSLAQPLGKRFLQQSLTNSCYQRGRTMRILLQKAFHRCLKKSPNKSTEKIVLSFYATWGKNLMQQDSLVVGETIVRWLCVALLRSSVGGGAPSVEKDVAFHSLMK